MIQITRIRNIQNLFTNDDDDDNYYKPILVKTSFKNNYRYYESTGGRDKKQYSKQSVKQYLYKIIPYLRDIINDHKTIRNESKEQKFK